MNDRCAYCGERDGQLIVEHMVPRRRGGPDTDLNTVWACSSCNRRKGDRTPLEWFCWQLERGEPIGSNRLTRWTDRRPPLPGPHYARRFA